MKHPHRKILLIPLIGGVFLFTMMSILYLTGWIQPLDRFISSQVTALHTPLFDRSVILLTRLGSPPALLIYTLAAGLYARQSKQWRFLTLFVAAVGGTALTTALFKELIARQRPLERLVEISSPSFPSWHSSTSAALAFVLWIWFAPRYGRRALLFFLWPLAIGLSRIWLNAHWCSDVLAGWGLGLAVAGTMTALFLPRPYRQGETSR